MNGRTSGLRMMLANQDMTQCITSSPLRGSNRPFNLMKHMTSKRLSCSESEKEGKEGGGGSKEIYEDWREMRMETQEYQTT